MNMLLGNFYIYEFIQNLFNKKERNVISKELKEKDAKKIA